MRRNNALKTKTVVDDFKHGDDVLIDIDGEPTWLVLMHLFGNGGGWGRRYRKDGTFENLVDDIVMLSGSEAVADSRVQYKPKRTRKGAAEEYDPLRG